jgi:glycosyltransferase involved in cell wall biosynthesis
MHNILFIHGNYPGQFRHLARFYGQRANSRVVYLTQEDYAHRNWAIDGVEIRTFPFDKQKEKRAHPYVHSLEDCVRKGQAIVREIHRMVKDGFRPDLVVFHAGNGYGMFLRDVLPKSCLIGYFEWYFLPQTAKFLTAPFQLDHALRLRIRNMPIQAELLACDQAIVPTSWQKDQFPQEFQSKLQVIFDGIDSNFFTPHSPTNERNYSVVLTSSSGSETQIHADDIILTYATRGMEPIRCFPEFMALLPRLVAEMPRLRILIAGEDRQAYSYPAPGCEGSWKRYLHDEAASYPGKNRVEFIGSLPYGNYVKLLQRTNLHCYFTHPYVLSWSLFEAISCQAPLCMNVNDATRPLLEFADVAVHLDREARESANQIIDYLSTTLGLDRRSSKKGFAKQANPVVSADARQVRKGLPQELKLSHCLRAWVKLMDASLPGSSSPQH